MPTRTIEGRMFQTRNDLPGDTREAVVKLLNQQLADTLDLYTQTKHAHWNVKGPDFYQLHELFDDLAKGVFEFIDLIAERATALGGSALGTARLAAQHSSLKEYPSDAIDGRQHLEALAERFGQYAASTRQAIETADEHHDRVTSDLFSDVAKEIDKSLWFLESHIQQAAKGA